MAETIACFILASKYFDLKDFVVVQELKTPFIVENN